jgi:protein dithiol oxidoreductase (disulfide-forming)
MLRRDFSFGLAAAGTAAGTMATLASAPLAQAQAARNYQEGTDYLALDKRVATEAAAGKVEVVEFFWYSCSHCNAFEPQLEAWIKKQPTDVSVRRVPVSFQPSFEPQQRLYYTLEALNKVDALHGKVFYAIHVEKQALNTTAAISTWAEKQGLDKTKFEAMYNSFGVASKARKATQLQNEFKVDGVPALGIAGRFYTSGALAQTMQRALEVVDFLVAQSRKSA